VQADRVELTAGQESRLFEVFFEHEYPSLVRLLFAMTADLHEADELAQEAMSRAWERWDRVSQMTSPAAYTFQIALNLQRRRVRSLRVRAKRIPLIRPTEPMPPHVPGEVVSALAMLPTGQRAALLLVEWVGMTADEASQILGITAEGVRTRIHRARQMLRRSLEDNDG
jgi:RNA polymerase sigma-70 factor (ECF subfamily)